MYLQVWAVDMTTTMFVLSGLLQQKRWQILDFFQQKLSIIFEGSSGLVCKY
jgi:hypothetical protein